MERTDLRFLGHRVTGEDLRMIQEMVGSCGGLTRMELARTVCELLGWRRRSRSLKARECREFLEKLEVRGLLVLPDKRAGRPLGSRTAVPVTEGGNAGAVIQGTAHAVGRLELELVRSDEGRRLFRELVGRYHYLGHAVPFGAHLRYLIYAEQPQRSVVACMQFSSAAWRIAVRDEWIGWDEDTRVRNLQHIVNNSRFLVLPWVEVKNLASRILSEAVRRMETFLGSKEACSLRESDLERELEKRGRELMRQLLEAHIEVRGPGEAAAPVEGTDGEERVQQRLHDCGLETVFGEVRIERAGYVAKGMDSLHPMNADLNLPQELYSHEVRRRVGWAAAGSSFDEVIGMLSETTGAHVGKRQVEELVIRAAEDFDAFYKEGYGFRPWEQSGAIMVVTVDGKGVVMRHEDLLVATQKKVETTRHKLTR